MRFQFRVDGPLSETARARFVDMQVTEAPAQTIVDGDIIDESHLHGVIAEFQALGIMVVSVEPIPEERGRADAASGGAEQSRPAGPAPLDRPRWTGPGGSQDGVGDEP